MLAEHFLDNTVDRYLQDRANQKAAPPTAPNLPTAELAFFDKSICSETIQCSGAESDSINTARNHLHDFLARPPKDFKYTGPSDATKFFIDYSLEITCPEVQDKPSAQKSRSSAPDLKFPLLVRGSPDSFYIRPDDPQLKSVSKATISLSDDGTSKKTTDKAILFLSYPIYNAFYTAELNIFPYAGIDHEFSKTVGKSKSTTNKFYEFGIQGAITYYASGENWLSDIRQELSIRPDYLINIQDHSRIISSNILYTPIVNAGTVSGIPALNDYLPIGAPGSQFQLEPIFEIHADSGWYTNRGVANQSDHLDYIRAGPKFGLSLSAALLKKLPIVITITEIDLFRIKGTSRTISYFNSALSILLDQNKIFSLDLTYTNGRREDT